MGEEIEREYGDESEFESDRKRLFGQGGWLVRNRRDRPANDGFWFPIEMGELPGALGCIVLVVGALAFLIWAATRRGKHSDRFVVTYEKADEE